MANWCSNTVEFRGEAEQLEKLKVLLSAMELKERAEVKGQLPEFIMREEGYLFDLETTLFPTVIYETRWLPNTEIIRQLADHFGLSFVHQYFEPMNGVSGEAQYFDGVLVTFNTDYQ